MEEKKIDWEKVKKEIEEVLGIKCEKEVNLDKFTSFNIGGPADLFCQVNKKEELRKVCQFCIKEKVPFFLLGGGSNILIGDKGIRGLVIRDKTSEIKIVGVKGVKKGKDDKREFFISCDSGVRVNRLVRYLIEEEVSGMEMFLGLPGTVGAGIFGNAHFGGNYISDNLIEVEYINGEGEVVRRKKEEVGFSYNMSDFKKKGEVILLVVFRFEKGKKDKMWEVANESFERRRQNQPYGEKSAGCVFGNINQGDGESSAGYYIDRAGLKGEKEGGVEVSDVHGNFVINRRSGKALDVVKLMSRVKRKVKEKFGIDLVEEIKLVGEF